MCLLSTYMYGRWMRRTDGATSLKSASTIRSWRKSGRRRSSSTPRRRSEMRCSASPSPSCKACQKVRLRLGISKPRLQHLPLPQAQSYSSVWGPDYAQPQSTICLAVATQLDRLCSASQVNRTLSQRPCPTAMSGPSRKVWQSQTSLLRRCQLPTDPTSTPDITAWQPIQHRLLATPSFSNWLRRIAQVSLELTDHHSDIRQSSL